MSLKQRIVEFARRASMEVTPKDVGLLPALTAKITPGTTVYVAHTPNASFGDVVATASKLESVGLRACPHVVARRLPSARVLRDGLYELSQAGVEQVLVIAGDLGAPLGPFSNSLEVLNSGALSDTGIRRVGVAGHPEGHRAIGPSRLWEALQAKQEFADRHRLAMHIVTQFGFNPQVIGGWDRHLVSNGITLPVHVGLCGPTSLPKLIKFAMHCGVGASLHALMKNMTAMSNVARVVTSADEMLTALVDAGVGSEITRIVQPHFFTFGGAVACARWLRAVCDGAFEMQPEGKLVVYG
jgi:methylenetetrahydrofolate reductase (NADPH)